jgi:PncC family amidohydrolase
MNVALEAQIGELLQARGLKLALAESCTGGLVGNRITDIAGSSTYFLGGLISYAYEAKVDLLGVQWETLNSKGAVSREVVLEMARGARKVLNADIAVSVSGIAGPGGAMPGKPVGTTWIGLVTNEGEWAKLFQFSGNRVQNKSQAAEAALQLLFDLLQGRGLEE